ncbi:MAG: hypothetical protein HXY35_07640 [Chloroflexi bacterium]|nr:hypothetical protein [Chloroflexota bacterium]
MEIEHQEQIIIDLLAKLKNAEGGYPKKLLASRRQIYLKQIANMSLGMGAGTGLKNLAEGPKGGLTGLHLPAIPTSTFLEAVLVVAIVIEAGIVAYRYRDKIVEILTSAPTARAEEVVPIPITGSSQPEAATPSLTPTATPTPSPANTPTFTVTATDAQLLIQSTDASATATPIPQNDNGNHYGQTPKPDRTKVKNTPKPTKAKKDSAPTEIYDRP